MPSIEEAAGNSQQYKWYVQCLGGDIRGPCDLVALKTLLDASFISDKSNVWCKGMESWMPFSELEELTQLLTEEKEDSQTNIERDISSSDVHAHQTKTVAHPDGSGTDRIGEADKDVESVDDEERMHKREKKRRYLQRKRKRIEEGNWLGSSKNLSVYISGLPDDTTLDEVANVFRRAGVIKIDPITTLPKIRLYTDDSGKFKNDAKVTFVNKESVEFAIRYLDNYHFREDCVIHVEEAIYDPHKYQKKPNVPINTPEMRKRYLAAKYEQERLQSWAEDIDDGTGRRIVICKPMFSADDAHEHEADSNFYEELREEVMTEITKFVPVDKVTPIPRHPQGVVCVKLKNSADAEIFISKFQGRIFDGRELQVYFFDGKTDLQAQTIPSKHAKDKIIDSLKPDQKDQEEIAVDWIDNQSSDEEFEIRTE